MKTVVITLPDSKDRYELFKKTNKNKVYPEVFDKCFVGRDLDYAALKKLRFDTDHNWIDPILKTPLTSGEVGCFLSHYHVWRECIRIDAPILVLEDDGIVGDDFSYDEIRRILNDGYNFLYLGWKEMDEDQEKPIVNEKYVVPIYPYWTLAYVVTPEAAKILCNKEIEQNIIPVDEYLPRMMSKLNPLAYKENSIEPQSRSVVGTECHPTDRYSFFLDFDIHPITIGTDESKTSKIIASGIQNGIKFKNIGAGVEWNGGSMKSTGGGQKINLIREYIKELPDHDVLFFCDGYDTFVVTELDEIIRRYLDFSHSIVFASERICWPNEELATQIIKTNKGITPYTDTPYKYLNSGLFVGTVKELRSILQDVDDASDDQLYYQEAYLSGHYDMALDLECYIFQCSDPVVTVKEEQMFNPITRCFNCVYHGNGGDSEKQQFEILYKQFYDKTPMLYIKTTDYEVIDDDMIMMDFLTPEKCQEMIKLAEDQEFHCHYADNVPSQDLRLKEIGLWNELEKHWNKTVYDVVYKYWEPCHMYGLRDAFIIKYTMDGQKSLRLHNDASMVTGSVKLNDDYTGGVLKFPRQGITNEDIPIGKLILFPGQCTHGHTSTELLSGTKYSLTIWSQRYKGDTL